MGKFPSGGICHPEGTLSHLKGIERDIVHQVIVDMVKIIANTIEVIGHGSGHRPQRFEERSSGSSQERKAPKDLNSEGLGVPATNS